MYEDLDLWEQLNQVAFRGRLEGYFEGLCRSGIRQFCEVIQETGARGFHPSDYSEAGGFADMAKIFAFIKATLDRRLQSCGRTLPEQLSLVDRQLLVVAQRIHGEVTRELDRLGRVTPGTEAAQIVGCANRLDGQLGNAERAWQILVEREPGILGYEDVYCVAFDMVGYSAIALNPIVRDRTAGLGIFELNREIEELTIKAILGACIGLDNPRKLVVDLAGDGGLVYFQTIQEAVSFAEEIAKLSNYSALNETVKFASSTDEGVLWRIGIASGKVAFRRKLRYTDWAAKVETGGQTIIDAVRIMSALHPAQLGIDETGFESLSSDWRTGTETEVFVPGKPHERRSIRTFVRSL